MTTDENNWQQKLKKIGLETFWFFRSRVFLKNALLIAITLLALFGLVFLFLRVYTSHGQSIPVDSYITMQLDEARKLSKKKKFNLVVIDSLHIVRAIGGTILNQTPAANARVKKHRNIYLTIAKYQADMVSIAQLPRMYGYEYATIKPKIEKKFQIDCRISGYKFDHAMPQNHVLEVIYQQDTVISKAGEDKSVMLQKGGTLYFVLNNRSKAPVDVPNMVCKRYGTGMFLVDNYGLKIGNIYADATVEDTAKAYIWKQNPSYDPSIKMKIGDEIDLFLTQERPGNCEE